MNRIQFYREFQNRMMFIFLLVGLFQTNDNVLAANLGDLCPNSMCSGANQICSEDTGRCVCEPGFQEEQQACRIPRKALGEGCTFQYDCENGGLCIKQVCACDPKEKYQDGSVCKERKYRREACTNKLNECRDPLVCYNWECNCNFSTYYIDGPFCEKKKLHAEACNDMTEQCMDTNAECRKGRCLCKSGYYHDGYLQQCRSVDEMKIVEPEISRRGTDFIGLTWKPGVNDTNVLYRLGNDRDEGIQNSTDSGGTLTRLTPGTPYTIDIETFLVQTDNYERQSAVVLMTSNVWTLPSKPGELDYSRSDLSCPRKTIAFKPSAGNVDHYKVYVSLNGEPTLNASWPDSRQGGFRMFNNSETYEYRVVAVNGVNDESEASIGSFNTSDHNPFESFKIRKKTNESIDLEWLYLGCPEYQIVYFLAYVYNNDSVCVAGSYLNCSDCERQGHEAPPSDDCKQLLNQGEFTNSEAKDTDHRFNISITSLTPDTEYTVKVLALYENYVPAAAELTFTTQKEDGEVKGIAELNVTSFRYDSDRKVGLSVRWTPAAETTSETNYTVSVMDTADDSLVSIVTLVGYEATNQTFLNLNAYHEYSVSVFAKTNTGTSKPLTRIVKTLTAIPSETRTLSVIASPTFATRIRLTFECPPEEHRNGVVQGFSIIKIDGSSGKKTEHEIPVSNCSTLITFPSNQLGNFELKKNYSFQVITKNQDFESIPSDQVAFYTAQTVPVFVESVLTEHPHASETGRTDSVSLCSPCLTDPQNGEITHSGLIVCVKSATTNCNPVGSTTMNVKQFKEYTTWAQAKLYDFGQAYRCTPDSWLTTLMKDKPTTYVIGQNTECSDDPGIYCNGPLPKDREFVVTAVSCNEAGCQAQSNSFEMRTRGSLEESGDRAETEMVVIIAAITICTIITLVLVAVIYRRCRANQHNGTNETPPIGNNINDLQQLAINTEDVKPIEPRRIRLRDFEDYVSQMHSYKNIIFHKEFETLQELISTRQRPSGNHSQDNSKYPPASTDIDVALIPGHRSIREYIVTQGPTHTTASQFWSMVWKNRTDLIVALASTTKNNEMEAESLNPNLLAPVKHGIFTVEIVSVSKVNKYIVKEIRLSTIHAYRKITHMFLPAWWETDCQVTPADILDFVQDVRNKKNAGIPSPLIVQCSLDVGWTGVYIALDYFTQFLESHTLEDHVDVFRYVLEMRLIRREMIQDEAQYVFLFDTLTLLVETHKNRHSYEHIYVSADSTPLYSIPGSDVDADRDDGYETPVLHGQDNRNEIRIPHGVECGYTNETFNDTVLW